MSPNASSEMSIENPEVAKSVIFDALRFAGIVLGVGFGADGLRFALDHIFPASALEHQYFASVVFSVLAGISWFLLSFFFLTRFRSGVLNISLDSNKQLWTEVGRTIATAICISFLVALSLWLAVAVNDEIFESRLLPWIAPLITFQQYGLGKAGSLFPCRMEGSDIGCEAYKFVPAILLTNTLIYFPFAFFGTFAYRTSIRARQLTTTAANMAVKLAVLLTAIGLISLLVMHGLGRDTHDSLYPNPGVAHWHFGLWELLNDVTGTVIVMAGTLVPFYFYRTCRRSENRATAKSRTRDLTILMTVLLLARMLGNVY